MIYIFEDNKDDLLSRLFRSGYTVDEASRFVYANGNGNILKITLNILQSFDEDVAIFIDMIPGNRDIVKIYNELGKLGRRYSDRLIVFPIVCSEYYFIKSIADTNVMTAKRSIVEQCILRDVYFDSELIQTDIDRQFCKNFEKFCKLLLIKGVLDCAKHSRKLSNSHKINYGYGDYYCKDCKCDYALDSCNKHKSTLDKALELLACYYCVPSGVSAHARNVTIQEAKAIHRRLVDEYNEMTRRYIVKDFARADNYKEIRYLV